MQEVVDRFLEGNFDYENGSLDFSCTELEFTLQKDQVYEGGFQVYGAPNKYTVGYVSASELHMECLTTKFEGSEEEIRFRFKAKDLEEGDVVKGDFYIFSNQGEYRIPYVVRIAPTYPVSSVGEIKNLFHFANLAKSNWEEAVRIFYSPEFDKVIKENEKQYYGGYLGLSVYPGNEQNLEEFLLLINKKQKIEYITEEKELHLDNPLGVAEVLLNIVRNGWGHTYLEVEVDGDFLFTEKTVLTDDDFLGNSCRLPLYVDSELLHYGKNYGGITLRNSYTELHIPMTVVLGEDTLRTDAIYIQKKRDLVQLMEYYQAFRLKKISSATWLKETGKLVEVMVNQDEDDVAARLLWAHILITRERYNEANWILEQALEKYERQSLLQPVLEAYYMYLTTFIKKDEEYTRNIAEMVRNLYHEQDDEWRLAWLLLYLSEELNRNPASKWSFIAQQFYHGCTSPALYVEALNLVIANPTLLRRLGRFEIQVLYYGTRQDVLSPEVVEQFCYLVQREKDYSPLLYKILRNCYQKNNDVRIVREICTLLIKGGKIGKEYFEWYRLGVEAELRITKLYEYYMMSMDLDLGLELPKILLLYFMYQNNLDYVRSAYLFSYVIHKKDAYPDVYANYLPRIERFVIEQIQKEHINNDLAGLYREFITEGMLNDQTASALSRLIFAYEIKIANPSIKNVIVYQPENLLETVYPVVRGETWVAYYNEDCVLVFEDSKGVRFVQGIEYTMERLLLSGKYLETLAKYVEDCPEFDLYIHRNCAWSEEGNLANLARWERLYEAPYLDEEVKREALFRILDFFAANEEKEKLSLLLDHVDGRKLSKRERARVVQYMLLVEQYENAYDWLCRYGTEYVEEKAALQVLEAHIEKLGYNYEKETVYCAHEYYQMGKYSPVTLQYLFYFYEGPLRELVSVWRKGRECDMDCTYLSERILMRILFTGESTRDDAEVFGYYLNGETDERIVDAYLYKNAHDYFMDTGREIPKLFEAITGRFDLGMEIPMVCKLAYLKYYADNKKKINEVTIPAITAFVKEMLRENVHMKLFLEFGEWVPEVLELQNKTIVQHKAAFGSRVKIHYVIGNTDSVEGEYVSEDMNMIYGGVCSKEFVLFFGETLQYYITEEIDGEKNFTDSTVVQNNDVGTLEKGNVYHLINDMVMSHNLKDYDKLEEGLEEYYTRQFYNKCLFTIK